MVALLPEAYVPMSGGAVAEIIRRGVELTKRDPASWLPQTDLGRLVKQSMDYLPPDLCQELFETITRYSFIESALSIVVRRFDGFRLGTPWYRVEDYGVVGRRVVTNAGADYLAKAFGAQGGFAASNFNYHALGTSSTAENVTDTALGSEIASYGTPNTRATGVRTNPSARAFRSVGANVVTAALTATEHMLMDQASTAGGTGWDRTVYAGQALQAQDQLQTTYDLTVTPGG